jgi:hypothetical protein
MSADLIQLGRAAGSDEQTTAVMFSVAIGVMLLAHDRHRQFTQRPICDARHESQASIRQGTMTASLILRKLGSYPAKMVWPSPYVN